jgi:hypothetical protein
VESVPQSLCSIQRDRRYGNDYTCSFWFCSSPVGADAVFLGAWPMHFHSHTTDWGRGNGSRGILYLSRERRKPKVCVSCVGILDISVLLGVVYRI